MMDAKHSKRLSTYIADEKQKEARAIILTERRITTQGIRSHLGNTRGLA